MSELPTTLDEAVNLFEDSVSLPKGFFNDLPSQDDWSFIIKIHALLETLVTQAICSAVGKTELQGILGKLAFANSSTGKMAFARELGLLDSTQLNYLVVLTKIRNAYVHDISSIGYSLNTVIDNLNESERLNICKAATPIWEDDDKKAYLLFLRTLPKRILWMCALGVISNTMIEKEKRIIQNQMLKNIKETIAAISENVIKEIVNRK